MSISSYEVTVAGKPEWGQIINARTSGQAKVEYHRDLLDAWPDIPWTALRCHKVGHPKSSERFIANAQYRGMPDLRCGDRVRVGDGVGTVVGHDCSCNIEVLFDADSPKWADLRLSVHPSELVRIEAKDAQNDHSKPSPAPEGQIIPPMRPERVLGLK